MLIMFPLASRSAFDLVRHVVSDWQ